MPPLDEIANSQLCVSQPPRARPPALKTCAFTADVPELPVGGTLTQPLRRRKSVDGAESGAVKQPDEPNRMVATGRVAETGGKRCTVGRQHGVDCEGQRREHPWLPAQ